ncbi:MAG: hypothetical protein IJ532_03265 [Alphaproteobacteria bacterium]|nr:hypothetical protein [Alphaproteobacteria bacterium]
MKKIVLFFVVCLFFLGCEDKKIQDCNEKALVAEYCDTSVVWRVKMHSFGNAHVGIGYVTVALENDKRLAVKYNVSDITKDLILLDKGDTIVYQGDQIVSVKWKRD